ncbi:MAG TPA: hypothetical protein VN282_11320 [Pyrinomonadaceae bacterium]|nr:hypothetical protein [Pyrinomonadaceae bacterium]
MRGISQDTYANLPDWKLTQVVGLPYRPGDIAPAHYTQMPQGYVVPNKTGDQAALMRLGIARLLQLPLPAIPFAGIPTPAWPAPHPVLYLNLLRQGGSSAPGDAILDAITACLSNTDDTVSSKFQNKFRYKKDVSGLQQQGQPADQSDPENKATFEIPVVRVTMANVSSDSYAATGLGYGTIDFPSVEPGRQPVRNIPRPTTDFKPPGEAEPPRAARLQPDVGVGMASAVAQTVFNDPPGVPSLHWDYMVTGPFTLLLGIKMELAAIATPSSEPVAAQSLTAASIAKGRPPGVDQESRETVRLRWLVSPYPEAYGVAVKRAGEVSTQMLNPPRGQAGGYQPYVPNRPAPVEGQIPPGAKSDYFDSLAEVPFNGNAVNNYLVIGVDVFGRWAGWTKYDYIAKAPKVAQPGINSVKFWPYGGSTGPEVPGRLVIEFGWDWTDRSPDRIEFTGKFFPVDGVSDPGAAPAAGFPVSPGFNASKLVVKFPNNPAAPPNNLPLRLDPPTLNPPVNPPPPDPPPVYPPAIPQLELVSAPAPGDPNNDVRGYRLTLENFVCDFTGTDEVGFAVYARGFEARRPAVASDPVGPRVAYVLDPGPPVISIYAPDVIWTALPDATNRARALLTWNAAPKAAEYMVWEATETALWNRAVEYKSKIPELAGVDVEAEQAKEIWFRADTLKGKIEETAEDFWNFARIDTRRPITEPRFEVILPATADILYLFRVSAVSKNNVNSGRSKGSFAVAVPRRIEPGPPRLLLRKNPEPGMEGVGVIALPSKGPAAAGFRVFRVQKETLARDVGLMGEPKYADDDPDWQDVTVPPLNGGEPEPGKWLLDPVQPSWFPYYYRVQAVGEHLPPYGKYRGESPPSQAQSIELLPAPPALSIEAGDDLENIHVDDQNAHNHIPFKTNVPFVETPYGWSKFELFKTRTDERGIIRRDLVAVRLPGGLLVEPNPTKYQVILSGFFPNIAVQTVHDAQTGMNEYVVRVLTIPTTKETTTKTQIDAEGNETTVTVTPPNVGVMYILRVTDPLGRTAEASLPQKLNPPPADM